MTTTTKKTVQVPVTSDGVPIVVEAATLDRTRELPACQGQEADEVEGAHEADHRTEKAAAPLEIVDEEITVPVQSSIESTLTFEMLRRQSKEDDED